MSLNNLANRQSEVGQREEALATAQEAVSLRRELVGRNRDAFLPDLAGSLNNLATFESAVGQRTEALSTAQEAVSLRRELVGRNRDAFAINFTQSQMTLGQALAALRRFPEAADSFATGLRTVLPYTERYPQALLGLTLSLLRGYLDALAKANLNPDPDLFAEAMRILGPHLTQQGEQK
jgi:tetratricopeptide (TPR) repeat protein